MTKTTRWGGADLLLAMGLLIATAGGAAADEAGDVRAGEALAIKACSPCHIVSERAGPPFAAIAKGPHATPNALRDFLRSTHSDVSHLSSMPSPELTEQQTDDIAAYVASLRTAK
jgi:mono/diheme cytochrome c family protein